MTTYVERWFCPRCEVLFSEPFPLYADRTPCFYCGDWAACRHVPEGVTGRVPVSDLIDYESDYLEETYND